MLNYFEKKKFSEVGKAKNCARFWDSITKDNSSFGEIKNQRKKNVS